MRVGDAVQPRIAHIPSVDSLLNHETLRDLIAAHGRIRVRDALRVQLAQIRADRLSADASRYEPAALARAIALDLANETSPSLRTVANLTGTVLHTNLGRALLPEEAIDAMARAARDPCNLEFDLASGERGERDKHVEDYVVQLTGAEAALVVNNNAAAVLLMLNTLGARRSTIVSRGELVEIGGQFRLPDIMTRAATRLVEVGTTNRTHARDYADAIGPSTAIVMKVHTSNYEIRGFTASVSEKELAEIAHAHSLPLICDLGSGVLADLRAWSLPHEPTVREALEAGADLVSFSGDKLLGGPQSGIVAGRARLIEKLRKNPLKRALRVDKLTLAALEQVLKLYGDPERLATKLPTLRMLARPQSDIRQIAETLAHTLANVLDTRYTVTVIECASQIGSGALPVAGVPSAGVQIEARVVRSERNRAVTQLQTALRNLPIPIVGRIDDGAIVLDCRCVEIVSPLIESIAALSIAQ